MPGVAFTVDLDSLLDTDGVLVSRTYARKLDSSFVYVNGLFVDRTAGGMSVDGSLVYVNGLFIDRTADGGSFSGSSVYVNSLLEDWTADGSINDGFVDVNGLLIGRRPVVVVMMTVGVAILNNRFGHTNVLAVTGLIASAVFTLDLVNGSKVPLADHRLGTVIVVMVVVSVGVDFNTGIRVRRSSGSGGRKTMSASLCSV